jgi:colicin import membrane protein
MVARDRPHRPRRPRGKLIAFALAIAVNLVFLAILVFSVSWTNRKPEAVTAELYAPAPASPPTKVEAPPAPPKVEPPPKPPEPKPPEPKPPEPKPPEPKPEPKPPPVEKPDTRAADIAQKAKAEAERKQQEVQKREQEKKAAEEKRQADMRDAMRREAERETQARQQAEREKQLRDAANRELADRQRVAAQQAADAAGKRALADWTDRIRAKVRSNVIEPPDLPGNAECVFEVTLLPTYEVLDVKLRKSSGVRAYDDAVQRAILKSSPLPRPDRADVFQRVLELRVRPRD